MKSPATFSETPDAGDPSSGGLRRVLSLGDLVIYGLILIQPVAALPLFGHANDLSRGHAVTTILIAMVAMIFTAISYGRMASRYPAVGSAYTYVGRGLHPYLGFVAGWSMFMDYMFIPILCVIFTSIAAQHLLPMVPYHAWVVVFGSAFTLVNLNGIKVTSRVNWLLMVVMSVVVFYFMGAAIRYIAQTQGIGGIFDPRPFYNAESFSWPAIGSATALAALTYIGFDGLTTLSEEVKNPRRNVLLAAVLTCVITGIWSGAQVYLAQVSWPDWSSFTRGVADEAARINALDTAIMAVANRVGGAALDGTLSIILLVGSVGSGITGQIGAARLLYGMGRDGVIPRQVFGRLDRRHGSPNLNIVIVGVLVLGGAFLLDYGECARLINFGAFLAFMGVNLAAAVECYFKAPQKTARGFFLDFLPPLAGFVICLIIWLNLPARTFLIGGAWLLAGVLCLAIRTKGFRETPIVSALSQT